MKHHTSLFLILLAGTLSIQLSGQDCGLFRPTAIEDLTSNGVTAAVTTGGDLWWNGNNGRYFIAEDSDSLQSLPISTVFAAGLWLAGKSTTGNVIGAFQQYGRAGGDFDFGTGPLDAAGILEAECAEWDRFFPISAVDRDEFLSMSAGGSVLDTAAIPDNVLGWPGRGNPWFVAVHGFELPQSGFYLAPFQDLNGDGLYDPTVGDYPLFAGDKALWCVFNDAVTHRQSGFPSPMRVEVQLLAYSFSTAADDPLFRTTFYDYTVVNRRNQPLSEMYIGHWIDHEIGCFTDDTGGSIPEEELVYFCNNGPVDETPCFSGLASFENTPPAQVLQVLNTSSDNEELLYAFIAGAGSIPEESCNLPSSPVFAEELHNLLRGRFAEGTTQTRGEFGCTGIGDSTRYSFDGGVAVDGTSWRACREGLSFSRSIYSTGPYDLQPGQHATFSIAMTTVFGAEYDGECIDETPIIDAARAIRADYENNFSRSQLTNLDDHVVPSASLHLKVFPNPTSNELTFRLPAGRTIASLDIFDATGRQVLSAQPAAGQLTVDLAAEGLAPGVHFYRLRTGNGTLVSGKVLFRE